MWHTRLDAWMSACSEWIAIAYAQCDLQWRIQAHCVFTYSHKYAGFSNLPLYSLWWQTWMVYSGVTYELAFWLRPCTVTFYSLHDAAFSSCLEHIIATLFKCVYVVISNQVTSSLLGLIERYVPLLSQNMIVNNTHIHIVNMLHGIKWYITLNISA